MSKHARAERRQEKHEMHIDRRKSDIDLIEHLVRGVRRTDIRSMGDESKSTATRKGNRSAKT